MCLSACVCIGGGGGAGDFSWQINSHHFSGYIQKLWGCLNTREDFKFWENSQDKKLETKPVSSVDRSGFAKYRYGVHFVCE